MIQRIQSIFLLIAAVLMGLIFFYPIADLLSSESQLYVYAYNGLQIANQEHDLYLKIIPSIVLLSVIVFISFASIFLYKKRIIQMRINLFNIILTIGYMGLSYYYINIFSKQLEAVVSYNICAIFPAFAILLTFFAIRAIGKDEALIRSMDRLR
ncbi:MAG: DUF4293 domain-containing protein [Bacteroidota bacterium]|nr:DUF4293 domain-containing protein [Bacteroidota bacterium]